MYHSMVKIYSIILAKCWKFKFSENFWNNIINDIYLLICVNWPVFQNNIYFIDINWDVINNIEIINSISIV